MPRPPRAGRSAKKPASASIGAGGIFASQLTGHLVFSNLDEDAGLMARWVAEFLVREDRWPDQVEFTRHCFNSNVALTPLGHDHGFDVFDGTITWTTPEDGRPVRVRPWIFFDLGLSPEAFKTAHDQVMEALHYLADGSAKSVTLTDELLPQGVLGPIRQLVGHILADNFQATRPGSDGRWSATVDMYKLRHPVLTLEDLLNRPERRRWQGVLADGSALPPGPKQPCGRLWPPRCWT